MAKAMLGLQHILSGFTASKLPAAALFGRSTRANILRKIS
jgi:hypothetical protein